MALFEQKEPLPGIVFWPQNGGYYYHTKREEEPASVLNGAIHNIDSFEIQRDSIVHELISHLYDIWVE